MYYMAKFTWWYGMFQYLRSVRVEYVVRKSSVTSLYIGHWKVLRKYKPCGQTDRQTDRFALTDNITGCGIMVFSRRPLIIPGRRYRPPF